jgi:hypothetical protein
VDSICPSFTNVTPDCSNARRSEWAVTAGRSSPRRPRSWEVSPLRVRIAVIWAYLRAVANRRPHPRKADRSGGREPVGHKTSSPTRTAALNANPHRASTSNTSRPAPALASVITIVPDSRAHPMTPEKIPMVRRETQNERSHPTGTPKTRRAACTSNQACRRLNTRAPMPLARDSIPASTFIVLLGWWSG